MKIEKKWWLIYFFFIYLTFLLYTGSMEYIVSLNSRYIFHYSYSFMWFHFNDLFLTIFYLEFFFIFYVLLYFLIFPFQNKKLTARKKVYLLLRDTIILFIVFCFFWIYNDVVWKYQKYYQWYLNQDNFWWDEFICMDNSATLLLEYNYPHSVIVNPYNNFYEFYKNYGNRNTIWWILTNKLPIELVTESFLTTCKNSKWENYYQKYLKIHWKEPYFKCLEYQINYKYILNPMEITNILTKLKNREYYIYNLIKHSYKELWLEITVDEFDNNYLWTQDIHDLMKEKRKTLFPDIVFEDINIWKYIPDPKSIQKITKWDIQSKWDTEYHWEDFWISESFYNKILKESWGWIDFYYDEKQSYTTTKTSLYKWENLIYQNDELYLWISWAFDNLKNIWELFSFEFTYFNTENNEDYKINKCEEILKNWKNKFWNCRITYNEDGSTWEICESNELLIEYKNYNKCKNLKYKNISSNIYLAWALLNYKYDILESKDIFEYNEKIWFIASSKEWYFIMYEWVQISENFDYIRTKSCCMIWKFPFKIYENWILEYVFSREDELYVWYINLKIK